LLCSPSLFFLELLRRRWTAEVTGAAGLEGLGLLGHGGSAAGLVSYLKFVHQLPPIAHFDGWTRLSDELCIRLKTFENTIFEFGLAKLVSPLYLHISASSYGRERPIILVAYSRK